MIGQNIKLYSWVDIQDQLLLAHENDKWLKGVKAEILRSGLYLYHSPKLKETQIREWLKTCFPNALNGKGILLESLGTEPRYLPVFFEQTEEAEIISPVFVPGFYRPKAFYDRPITVQDRPENSNPVIIAAHSFKGGVGRTLHALALALALEDAEDNGKVLLIDADFEAPGITWMVSNPEIAFVDLLNLILSSAEPQKIIPSIAEALQNQRQGDIYFLPSFRTDRQLRSLEVKPEHITRFADDPFIITDFIVDLARKLGTAYVIIDLRAGISELSANWLLDPRVAKIFVTTLNSQSVEGTLTILDLLIERQKNQNLAPKDNPAMIISQANPDDLLRLDRIWNRAEDGGVGTAGQNIGKLREAFSNYLQQCDFEEDDGQMIISPIYDSLMVFPNDWSDAGDLIKKSGLLDNVKRIAKLYQIPAETPKIEDSVIQRARKIMEENVPNLVYAEKYLSDGFYKSRPIRNLANRHRTRLPNLVIIGAKGAGKTFLFRQIFRNGNWMSFIQKALSEEISSANIDAKIVQATIPEAIEQKTEVWVRQVKPYLVDAVSTNRTINDWKNIWLDIMAWSYGFKVGEKNIGDLFIDYLELEKQQTVFLFDGLEDLFPDYYQIENKQIAMRALLQDVHSYVGVTPNAPIGVLTFIRRDMLEHVFKQNLGQFVDRHKEFELKWDRTEALRLVAWVMSFYKILDIPENEIPQSTEDVLTKALFPLWGRKLGTNLSREAASAKNILGKLSNFNQEVQSRDLIRFLSEAISQEVKSGQNTSEDRILSPRSIKDALPEVGKAKVREVKEENKNNDFEKLLIRLERLAKEDHEFKVPFESLNGLSHTDINLLMDQGVLRRHEDKFYMAELFRLGLGIDKRKGRVKTDF